MAYYEYVARTTQGKTVTGALEAVNQSAVVKMLREKGLMPTAINEGVASLGSCKSIKKRRGRIKLDDMVVSSRQFATMIRAGLPLIEVLNILSDQADKMALQTVLKQIEKDVESGASLTEAMQKHPKVYDLFFISMIRAGETAGMLDAILDQIAGYLEKSAALRRKIKSAVMYPTVVTIAACGRTRLTSGAISPAWFMPISNTPKPESAGIRASVSGTPQ